MSTGSERCERIIKEHGEMLEGLRQIRAYASGTTPNLALLRAKLVDCEDTAYTLLSRITDAGQS